MRFAATLLLVSSLVTQRKPQAKPEPETRATLTEQKECYDQAQKFFDAHTLLVQHYSKRQNVCFVRTYSTLYRDQKYDGTEAELRDAFENTMYGLCMTDSENKVLVCWLSDPMGAGAEKTFHDMKSWLDLTMATYLSKTY